MEFSSRAIFFLFDFVLCVFSKSTAIVDMPISQSKLSQLLQATWFLKCDNCENHGTIKCPQLVTKQLHQKNY